MDHQQQFTQINQPEATNQPARCCELVLAWCSYALSATAWYIISLSTRWMMKKATWLALFFTLSFLMRLHVAWGSRMESGWYLRVWGQQGDESRKTWTTDPFIPVIQSASHRRTPHTQTHTHWCIHIDAYTMALTPVTGQCSHWTHIQICHHGSPLRTITHHRRGSRPITWWRDPSPSTIGRKPKNTQYTDHQTLARGSSERGETQSGWGQFGLIDFGQNVVLSKAWAHTHRRVHKRSTRLLIVHQKFFQTHAFDLFQTVKVHVYVLREKIVPDWPGKWTGDD